MNMKLKGTQTEKNLQAAFAGESQARNKYTYFASKAKKEGFEPIIALDGQEALDKFEANKAELVMLLLDVMMPKIDGFTVCKNIRKISNSNLITPPFSVRKIISYPASNVAIHRVILVGHS